MTKEGGGGGVDGDSSQSHGYELFECCCGNEVLYPPYQHARPRVTTYCMHTLNHTTVPKGITTAFEGRGLPAPLGAHVTVVAVWTTDSRNSRRTCATVTIAKKNQRRPRNTHRLSSAINTLAKHKSGTYAPPPPTTHTIVHGTSVPTIRGAERRKGKARQSIMATPVHHINRLAISDLDSNHPEFPRVRNQL